jgi:hypothetical protein
MSFYDIATDMLIQPLYETTTMDAITFLPAHMGTVQARIKQMAKEYEHLGIEVLEREKYKDVRFGDQFRVRVFNEHWDDFSHMFGNQQVKTGQLDIRSFLNEAMEDEVKELRRRLKASLVNYFSSQTFRDIDEDIQRWNAVFGTDKTMEKDVVVSPHRKERDVQALYGRLLRAYGDDRGYLERLIQDLQEQNPVNAYDGFKAYPDVYGARVQSKVEGHTFIFEAVAHLDEELSESIYIDAPEVLDEISDMRGIKVVGNVVYPVGQRFQRTFFSSLRDAVDDTIEGEM